MVAPCWPTTSWCADRAAGGTPDWHRAGPGLVRARRNPEPAPAGRALPRRNGRPQTWQLLMNPHLGKFSPVRAAPAGSRTDTGDLRAILSGLNDELKRCLGGLKHELTSSLDRRR